MTLTPLDIQKKEFRKSFRGYSEEEVKDFLEKVTQSYEKLYRENQELKEEIKFLREKLKEYQELETTLKKAIILAEKAAEDLKRNAEREKELIIKDARVKAEEMLAKAKMRCDVLSERYEEIKAQFQLFKTRFLNFLQSQIDLINSAGLDGEDYVKEAAAGHDFEGEEGGENGDGGGKEAVGGGDNSL
ncbi:cell division initiation protein [Caldanaerovirga acetigignens]|uniref:Cell division initiation protein n=1 Tax=Caldanaerovirga acetigignens TaxID=447595 RepID=A0A1M7FUK2_9FIRM|nr:DivIVA domain-containing protein [Caldanaerovirga acetigignens]SHM07812.1 cell division initiation protein [Caldanaerovirga acetigignens]